MGYGGLGALPVLAARQSHKQDVAQWLPSRPWLAGWAGPDPAHRHFSDGDYRPKLKNRRKPKIQEKPGKRGCTGGPPFAGTPGIG
jgi:hypothetical protein